MLEKTSSKISLIDIIPAKIGNGIDQFDLWHESARPFFDTIPLEDPKKFSGSGKSAMLDNLVFIKTTFSKQGFVRSSRQLSSGNSDFYILELYLKGKCQGEIGSTPITMLPNRIQLFDYSYPLKTKSNSEYAEVISVTIPRHLLKTNLLEKNAAIFWSTNSVKGRILIHNFLSLWNDLPQIKQEEAPQVAREFIGLLNGLLPSHEEKDNFECFEPAMFKTMKNFIEQNLFNPCLSAEILTRQFHVSRPTVYRLFKEVGGVKYYLNEQRLCQAYQQLRCKSIEKMSVSQVAQNCGFNNISYFSRLFKQRFGLSPSELLNTYSLKNRERLCGDLKSLHYDIAMFHRWLEQN